MTAYTYNQWIEIREERINWVYQNEHYLSIPKISLYHRPMEEAVRTRLSDKFGFQIDISQFEIYELYDRGLDIEIVATPWHCH